MYLPNNMFYNHRKRENRKTKTKDAAVGVCLLDNIVVTRFRNEYWNVTCNMAYCCIDLTWLIVVLTILVKVMFVSSFLT